MISINIILSLESKLQAGLYMFKQLSSISVHHRIEEAKQYDITEKLSTKNHPTFKLLLAGMAVEDKDAS